MSAIAGSDGVARCEWAYGSERMRRYHDEEWGVPQHDDRRLFKMLLLEGQQAGLSWSTILNKEEAFDRAYSGFDALAIAGYGEADVQRLLGDAGVVRNRLKVAAAVQNARAYLALRAECGSLDAYLWGFVDGKPVVNRRESLRDTPARTPLSDAISKDLKRRGFKFVGSTIVYALLQSVGVVNDHVLGCAFR